MFQADSIVQTSPGLVAFPNISNPEQQNSIGVYDFLSKSFAYVPLEALYWLQYFKSPQRWSSVLAEHSNLSENETADELEGLVSAKFVAISGSNEWTKNEAYRENWKWDLTSALFHFTVSDNEFASPEEAVQRQLAKMEHENPPALSWAHGAKKIPLPTQTANQNRLLNLMARRRTNRTSQGKAVSLKDIGECLFSGLGITGYVQTPTGMLPLGMTPSGGARNPYEAFVFINRGKDIARGVYHYSASENSLIPLGQDSDLPKFSTLLANQTWADDMAIAVVLVAVLERTMWKYPDPNAYRVTLIEAGHIVQNIMLTATNLGLSACPTAAMSHSIVSEYLGLTSITHVPIYAFTLDQPMDYPDTISNNDALAEGTYTKSNLLAYS